MTMTWASKGPGRARGPNALSAFKMNIDDSINKRIGTVAQKRTRTSIPNQLLRTLFDLMPRTKNSLVGGSQVLEGISSKVNLRLNRA